MGVAPEPLQPLITMSWAYGDGTILTTRPPRAASRFLRGRETRAGRDQGTAAFLPLSGTAVGIAARSTLTPPVLDLLEEAGHPIPAVRHEYQDERGYERLLARLARVGHRFAMNHFHPLSQIPREAWWIDPVVFADLNDKASLARYVPRAHRPRRVVAPLMEVRQVARGFQTPFLLKASTGWSSGSGMAVRIISSPAELQAALREWRGVKTVVVEEFQTFTRNLCLNYATDGNRVRYLGSGEQLVDGTAYLGSWVDRESRAPKAAIALGHEIMERGRQRGYIGIAGFDIGITPRGHPIAFDLNFRLCGSTLPLLYQDALRERSRKMSCSTSIRAEGKQGAKRMLATTRAAVRAGIFLPYAIFTPEPETCQTHPVVYGLILGRDRQAVERNRARLARAGLE